MKSYSALDHLKETVKNSGQLVRLHKVLGP